MAKKLLAFLGFVCYTCTMMGLPIVIAASPFTVSSSSAGALAAGAQAQVPLAVTNNGASVSNAIVDVEIYDASGNRSFQQFFDNQNLSQGATENYSV
ncbi:MAG TPA: hypothetical protein VNG29_04635, partial [Candidatus Paceibacterota bacterium]|nr:hypothetical protein [Candidatus Paceibacterota bacterium]